MKNLSKLREDCGISQQVLATHIGVSQQSIHKYETSQSEPDVHTMIKIAAFFKTSVDYLIGNSAVKEVVHDIGGMSLNDKQIIHIKAYSRLSDDNQEIVDNLIQGLLKTKAK